MGIPFTKMNGCGNDFIVIDNRMKIIPEQELSLLAQKISTRRISLGADGLLILDNSEQYDFKMRLFNPDGSEGEMCGNGARCIARYAVLAGIAGDNHSFETLAGRIDAWVSQEVEITLPEEYLFEDLPKKRSITLREKDLDYYDIFVGVPHCVVFLEKEVSDRKLAEWGREIRFNRERFPQGTNVNFVWARDSGTIFVRTYERGVEELTLACGTGSTASALIASIQSNLASPVKVITRGGPLEVRFIKDHAGFKKLTLVGAARVVARGELFPEAFNW